jgi:glycerol-3-phosphate dehydrogenase
MNRESHIKSLQRETFDLLVIGGGATGTGAALDAASRGLRVALIERDDFSSGTSSRSTKLVHGGVRYLEQAVLRFDRSQFNLVRDALHERSTLLRIAPHLVHPLGILTPLYNWLEVPYYTTGLRLYDKLSGKASISPSRFLDKREALAHLPQLNQQNLKGGVLYYDGQFDDARMNVCLALTASEQGAVIANHVAFKDFVSASGKLVSAKVQDLLTNEEWEIRAKAFVNAAGPFADEIRMKEDPNTTPMLSASSGVHIVLDKKFSSPEVGLLIPKTDDGRVLFHLPWLGHTLLGTTDSPAPVEANPKVTSADLEFILGQLKKYLSFKISSGDILSSWVGLRPLVSDPKASDTAKLSRDHIIHVGSLGLITIAGGKWTTYRKMGLDVVNEVVSRFDLKAGPSRTEDIYIVGGEDFSPENTDFLKNEFQLDADIASHLNHAYGDRAVALAKLCREGLGRRLSPQHPYIEAEVVYGANVEAARTPVDILARRTRISFLDFRASLAALPKVTDLLAKTLGWNESVKKENYETSLSSLEESFSKS